MGGGLQTKLREVELRVIDNKHCRDMYGLMHNIVIQNYHLCAGPILQGGKGTCIVSLNSVIPKNIYDGIRQKVNHLTCKSFLCFVVLI